MPRTLSRHFTMRKYHSQFIPLRDAIESVGDHEDLLAALKDGAILAQGRYTYEGSNDAAEPEGLTRAHWLDWNFDLETCSLSRLYEADEAHWLHEAYVCIRIKRKEFEKVFSSLEKGGRPRHPAWPSIEAELERLMSECDQKFKNISQLVDHLRTQDTLLQDPPDASNVRKWLKRRTGWEFLIVGKTSE